MNHENTFPLDFWLWKEWLEIRAEFTEEEKANDFSLSLCVMAATVLYAAGKDPVKIQWLVTAVICIESGVCTKAKGKGHDEKELRQYHSLPKDRNNSGTHGFGREETRFLKDQEIRYCSRGWRNPNTEQQKGWMKCSCGAQANILKLTIHSKILPHFT